MSEVLSPTRLPYPKAQRLVDLARARGWQIATAESCTGGGLAAAITDVAGSSNVFGWGVVSYGNGAKQSLLGVRAETLARHGAVSEAVACEMAEGARQGAGADLALSVTGIAGPGGSDFKPEGRVCFGLAQAGRPTQCETVEFGARGRALVRAASVDHALALLIAALEA